MTPDQLARIERNKQLAMEKRAARLGVFVASLRESDSIFRKHTYPGISTSL